jgi:F-type H+-transporting ATPase subunit delta
MASGAAKRYADAVFLLGKEQGTLDQWSEDLALLGAVASEPVISAYLRGPSVSQQDKLAVVDQALQSAQPEARNLARLLVERQRISIIPDLLARFGEALLEERGIALADVTTAVELSPAEVDRIRQQLSSLIGREVDMRMHVDPAMIGGIVARIGDLLIDGSVASQLSRLRERLSTAA